jgi:exopolysaccharide biosynthesis WecB/TagA/CpsF family protein
MAKLITVGLPVWNSMLYLPETMRSLLEQTEHDFDILAIVDPSTDGSLAYLQSIQDPRLRVIVHEERQGLAATLNEMLREVATPWLVRQDSDDVAYPNRLARIAQEIARHPDTGMFYSLAEFHPADLCVGLVRQTRGKPHELRKVVRSGYLVTIVHPTVALNVEKTLRVGGYNVALRTEDMELWWRMILDYDVRLIPEVLLGFRTNPESLMSRDLKDNVTVANILYVQYLLLSRLWGYRALPQASIQDILLEISAKEDHRPRVSLRECNIYLSRRQYLRAGVAALRALLASPSYCIQRVGDELLPSRQRRIRVGYHPSIFRQLRNELWPEPPPPAGYFPAKERVFIGPLPLDTVTFDEAVGWALDYIGSKPDREPARISCPNASLVALADGDEGFAHIVRTSNLVVADGLPLVWAASLLGTPLGGQIRGVDLMERICAALATRGMSFYILGGLPGAAEITASRLMERYPGLRLAGVECPPVSFETDPEMNRRVREKIIAARPDFLIVALGSPKQERWMYENFRDLPVGIIHGVGAAVDTFAGLRKRPPVWMRTIGLEWLGRLLSEPHRLWRRYIFGNSRFIYIIFRQWRSARELRTRRVQPS